MDKFREQLAKKLVAIANLLEKAKGQMTSDGPVSPKIKVGVATISTPSVPKPSVVSSTSSKKDPVKQAQQMKNLDFKDLAVDEAKQIKEIKPLLPSTNSPKNVTSALDPQFKDAANQLRMSETKPTKSLASFYPNGQWTLKAECKKSELGPKPRGFSSKGLKEKFKVPGISPRTLEEKREKKQHSLKSPSKSKISKQSRPRRPKNISPKK